jgi:hypothetical protein
MRAFAFATFLVLLAAEAVAQSITVPRPAPNFEGRLNACVADWHATAAADRGSMNYRQFTTRCLEGGHAKPVDTVALCNNGTTAPATAAGGACAYDGGVERWLD